MADDCVDRPCGPNGRCVDGIREYPCECYPGYELTEKDECIDIDHCANDPCGPNGICSDYTSMSPAYTYEFAIVSYTEDSSYNAATGTYMCDCNRGYEFQNGACLDIDDCASNPCDPNGKCIDGVDKYSCNCNSGYEFIDGTCMDIDNCGNNPCGDNGTCVDGIEEYSCECDPGYDQTDGTCLNVDDCYGSPCGPDGDCIDGIDAVF